MALNSGACLLSRLSLTGLVASKDLALTPTGKPDIHAGMVELRVIEKNIIEALGTDTLTLEQLAPKAGYEVNGHFKKAVSSLSKQGILGNKRPGYFVHPEHQGIFSKSST